MADEKTAQDIIAGIPTMGTGELQGLLTDDRKTVVSAAQQEIDGRTQAEVPPPDFEPSQVETPTRFEDTLDLNPEGFEPAPLSAEEVPLEDSRRDDTSVLATDRFGQDGNRIS